MRYRILIKTFLSGRQEFRAEKKVWLGWRSIAVYGGNGVGTWQDTREQALKRIDNDHAGNTKIKSIEIEYITK